jgi:hypothetical protein
MTYLFPKRTLLAFMLLCVTTHGANAQTLTRGVAWLWSTEASPTATITPNTLYSYNSAGGAITLAKFATGIYNINFAGLSLKTTAKGLHISAYGGNHHCVNFANGTSATGYTWQIRCFAPDGTAKDGLFTAIVFEDDRQGWDNVNLGYAPPATNISTTPTDAYNSRGLGITVDKYETGLYRVVGKGIQKYDGTLMATAFTQDVPRYCVADSWAPSGTGDLHAFVRCFDNTGKMADAVVMISYRRDLNVGTTINGAKFHNAYVFANGTTTTPTVDSGFSKNTASTTATTITRNSVGFYNVNLAGLASADKTTALVNGLGDQNTYCNVAAFAANGSGGTTVQVRCYNPAGAPADARFVLQYFTNTPNGTLTATATEAPTNFELSEAYPNPFNPSTSFTLSLVKSQNVAIKVFNMMGQQVATLHEGILAANTKHAFSFEAKGLTSGTYFIRATGEDFSETRMATLLK